MLKTFGFTVLIIGLTLILGNAGFAHLKSDPGVECFKMVNGQVQEIQNTLTQSAYAEVLSVEVVPAWGSTLMMGDALNLHIRFRIAHCRPFTVFAQPVNLQDRRFRLLTSPSPTYEPGEYEGSHSAFIRFELSDSAQHAIRTVDAVKVRIQEYGTGKLLAELEYPVSATWTPTHSRLRPTERCVEIMEWPESTSHSPQCTNASTFQLSTGFKLHEKVDINTDGICELLVEVESCRKLNNNICFKIYEESNSQYREIWQYYNTLKYFNLQDGYYRLGSTETGPKQNVHRIGTFDLASRRYVTERILEPCRD